MVIPTSKMGEVGDGGHWRPADASTFNGASSNLLDVETNTCGICSTEVVNRGVLDCCNHWFCFSCIDDWATVTNLCPLCKARFRFITCLPVGYGDPDNPDNIGAGFAKRVDGSADEESNFAFSFPSYFIDEEAVVCLEGDACRVRAGMPSLEVEGALAADTSVACDLCDCWYHAGCVDFDPEQSSFYCPRCVASQEKPRNSFQTGELGTRISSEARASSLVGSLPAEKELSFGGGNVLGSASVAIAVAEKGESAVSISMRRIPVQANGQPPTVPQDRKDVMRSAIREPVPASKSYGPMWSPIREPVNASQSQAPIWSPIREPLNISQNYDLWSPTPAQDENDEELWSPTPESERTSASIFKEPTTSAPLVPGKSVALSDSRIHDKTVPEVSTSVAYAASAPRSYVSKRLPTARGSNLSVEMDAHTQVAPKAVPSKNSAVFASPVDTEKDEKMLIDGDTLHSPAEQSKKGKRKTLQEDERRIESKDLPEPPRKVSRKSTTRSNASIGRNSAVGKDCSEKILGEESAGDKPDDIQSKCLGSAVVIDDAGKNESREVPAEETVMELIDEDHHRDCSNEAVKEKTPEEDPKSKVDVMDIVKDSRKQLDAVSNTGERSSNQKGVRTRIIMHRETDAKEAVGSGLVDRIRQQMTATAGYIGGEDLSKVEVSDDRFLAAFKAALLSSREKHKETKTTSSRRGTNLWLDKVMNRKGKGSRDSLTRKLYAGGTGRYDRDWDIAFWKERSAHFRTAQKEAENEITGKHARQGQPEEEDSIFSRIYVADTSLFPRNDDVQLLSEKVKNLAEGGGKKTVKAPQLSHDKASLQGNVANNSAKSPGLPEGRGNRIPSTTTSKVTLASSKDGSVHRKGITGGLNGIANLGKPGSSPKVSTKSGLVQQPVSATSVTPSTESAKGDVKKDKRQWALEVLARKTGSSSNTPGSAKATGGPDNREGQFALLLQLPIDMRPLLQHNRHSKVPTAVRQVQLNRFVEQELRNAKVGVIQNSPERQEAVNRAKAREEDLYQKSNSKGVYVNLCVRSLAQTDTAAKQKQEVEEDHSDAIQKALEATGLVESPSASPSHEGDDTPASGSKEAKVSSKDSGDIQKSSCENKWTDDILEIGNLDTFGDFEFNPDTDLEDASAQENVLSSKSGAATAIQDSDNRTKKMTVLLSNPANAAPEPVKALPVTFSETSQLNEVTNDGGMQVDPLPTADVLSQAQPQMKEGDDLELAAVPISMHTIVTPKSHSAHSISSPSKKCPHASLPNQDLKSCGGTAEGVEKDIQVLSDNKKSESLTPPVIQNMDDWMNSGKFADLDRRIENIRQNTSPSVNKDIDVPWNSKRSSIELATQTDLLTPQQSVQKQVEIYVNQHLKPLYRSGVINSDQFRYAVSKTAAKVMEHHENATTAEFLITEGSKVRKLADQYLQNYTKRKAK
ncbi:unnamed protein product [Calypogeia fissa]